MSWRIVNALALAEQVEQRQDKLHALPRRDVWTVAPGKTPRVVPTIVETWDGNGARPLGWTSYRGSRVQHPTLSQWAVPIDPETAAALANGRAQRLTAQEQADMAADLAASVASLPGDWFPGGAGVAVPGGGRRP